MTTTARSGQPFYGWRVVGAAFVLATFGWGIGFFGPPVFLSAIQATRGLVARPRLDGHHACISWSAPSWAPTCRRLHRRFGAATVTKAGALSHGRRHRAAGPMRTAPWQLFAGRRPERRAAGAP